MRESEAGAPPAESIAVMVVEDSAAVGRELVSVFNGGTPEMRCVALCASGEEALARLPQVKPAVVFMDINLPGISGVECLRRMLALQPDLLVIMLTVYDNAEAIFESLRAGASGFLHKPVRAEELRSAVREVYAGGSPMTGLIARKVLHAFRKITPAPRRNAPAPEWTLTEREQQVLEALAAGCLYKEIAEQMGLSWHTIHVHIRHIYKKLRVRSRTEAVTKFLNR